MYNCDMNPPINPFRLQRMGKIQATASSASPQAMVQKASGVRGMAGEERAQAMGSLARDVSARAARVHYLKTLGQSLYEEIKDEKEIGSSRLAWLNRQLNQNDF